MKTIPDLMMEVSEEFSIDLIDEDACRDFILKKVHQAGVFCPECRTEITSERKLKRFWNMLRVVCPVCAKNFSAVTGTELNKIGIPFRSLYLLLFLVSHGAKANNIWKQLKISNGASYQWANKARGKSQTHE